MDNALRPFDYIIIASEYTPELDHISNELKKLYGDGFIELKVDESASSPYSSHLIFEQELKKLNDKSTQLYESNHKGPAIALIRYTSDVICDYMHMLIDYIIEIYLCFDDIYFIRPKRKRVPYNPSTNPMMIVKYETKIITILCGVGTTDTIDDRIRDIKYQITYDYDPMSSEDLIVYLSNINQRYHTMLTALEGLNSNQKAELLGNINMSQYKDTISDDSIDAPTKKEAFKRFFRDCCLYKPGGRLTQTDLFDALYDYCKHTASITLDEEKTRDIKLFVAMFKLETIRSKISEVYEICVKDLDIDLDKLDEFVSY